MIVIVVFTFVLLALGVVENSIHRKRINNIEIRILINGTRGKSSTVRLINSALNHCGIRSVAKSTGSEAVFILPDLSEVPINRKHGKNAVREQRKLFKIANQNNCRAVVCECSAVRPESQKVYADKLVRPNIVAITNTRPDHEDQMGSDTEDVILLSAPSSVKPITEDNPFQGPLDGFRFKVHPSAVALALKVCKTLGIDEEKALEGMKQAKGDIGMTGSIEISGKTIINGFAVNDVESAKELFKTMDSERVSVVYANRKDREYRLRDFKKLFETLGIRNINVIGDNLKKSSRILCAKPYSDLEFGEMIENSESTIICCGNIVGSGSKLISYCLENTI